MSWIKQNYHVAALAGGAVVLAGLGYLGYSASQTAAEGFAAGAPPKKTNPEAEGGPLADALMTSLTEPNVVVRRKNPNERPVNLFTSVDLYEKDGKVVDILEMREEVHAGIKNSLWVDHRIDPSWSDAPTKDEDGDGFTNAEEFAAKTDPNDDKSHGALIAKLEVDSLEIDQWLLAFKSVIGDGFQFDLTVLPHAGGRLTNRIPARQKVQVGDSFFTEEPGKERFKLTKIDPREEQTAVGLRDVNWAIIEDLKPNKNGATYEIPYNMKRGKIPQFTQFDVTVNFRLNAIGEDGNVFQVEESGTFSLPAGAEEKPFKVVGFTKTDPPENAFTHVIVEWEEDGEKKRREVPVPSAPEEEPEEDENE